MKTIPLKSKTKKELWIDWRWQVQNTIRDIDVAENLMGIKFAPEDKKEIKSTTEKFPFSITPYYLSLIDPEDYKNDPIFKQAFPSINELQIQPHDINDPLAEDKDSPVEYLTHRYPDRVLFCVSNTCAMYCRHCTRKRRVGDKESIPNKAELTKGIEYIRNTPMVRDVLLSGGDPFLLPDAKLKWLLEQITSIPHVEMVRIGTRVPAVLPYRITRKLVSMLKAFQPIFINCQFNHPRELTSAARASLARLADGGFPLGNQSVLLAGINDCPRIIKSLSHKLLQNRVRPYYLYQCDLSEGLTHFRTPVGKGIEIMESLIGHTTGMGLPSYVIDAPGGGGKIPVRPQYLISWSTNKVILRNYEGVITSYKEPDSYEPVFCDRKCDKCNLYLKLDPAEEKAQAIGIEKLLVDYDDAFAITPAGTERIERRNGRSDDSDT